MMDAVKFIEERNRMCKSFGDKCTGCPAFTGLCCVLDIQATMDATAQIDIIENWSAAHPRKTRQSVFLEQWPNAIVEYGTLTICPKVVLGRKGWAEDGCGGILCNNCRRDFWMQEVE